MGKGIVVAIATGLLALWLFLSFTSSHEAQKEVFNARVNLDNAKFDKEFSEALGKDTAANDKEIETAKNKLEVAETTKNSVDAERRSDLSSLKRQTEEELGNNGVNLDKIKAQIQSSSK